MAQTATPSHIQWLATDEISDDLADQWREPAIAPDTLAMLQYTSGSTSRPKGVMISHANLMDNARTIDRAFEIRPKTAPCSGCPPTMTWVWWAGFWRRCSRASPMSCSHPSTSSRNPSPGWPRSANIGPSVSGGPNFAYDLCVRKITDEQRATLDLSSWELAFIGAEPIHPATLERFAAAFAPCGFKPSAFYPCYGLAEATLMVSGARRGGGAIVRAFHDSALTENRVELMPGGNGQARCLVACGSPVGSQRVVIVDSQTHMKTAPGQVGEIWVAGPSVGQGYWHQPDQTRHAFNARLSDTGEGPFLRTGDLGFMCDGQLYITGRREDLIIVRGLNRYPQDIEATARNSHPLLEAGYGAAFAVDDNGSQRLVLVHEVERTTQRDLTPVLDAVRRAVLDEHDLALDALVLVRSNTIPKTSSGKVQRHVCREAFLAGELKTLAEYRSPKTESPGPGRRRRRRGIPCEF